MRVPVSHTLIATLALACALLASGCGQSESEPESESSSSSSTTSRTKKAGSAAVSPAAAAEATKIFQTRCSPCHGAEGKGDGPTSKGLNPHPRNFQDHDWQTKITDVAIERIIREGGAAVGKSPLMPPNPDLSNKPEVVKALRAHIRQLGSH